MIERIHHTSVRGLITSSKRKYQQEVEWKPNGLWYGIGWAWDDWCRTEMPDRYKYHKKHFFLDMDMSRILLIDSPEKMTSFAEEYHRYPSWISKKELRNSWIDWKAVSIAYSGIEISPYRFDFRHKYLWYYGWDVSSGCVWDLSAIKSVSKAIRPKNYTMEN